METKSIVFVSYSHNDKEVAVGLAQELQNLGANVWIDQMGIKLGQHWDNTIEEALDEAKTLLVLISNNSVTSQNVQDEVSIAINEKKKIVPILIEQCELPMRWQRLHYADFIANPEKSLNDVLEALEIKKPKDYVADRIYNILKSLKFGGTDLVQPIEEGIAPSITLSNNLGNDIEALLISEEEIERASLMHQKIIKSNKITILSILAGSLVLLAILSLVLKTEPAWLVILGCVMLNLVSIRPLGHISKSSKTIELIELLKLKRQRLIRIINKLNEKEVDDFNTEFTNYISI